MIRCAASQLHGLCSRLNHLSLRTTTQTVNSFSVLATVSPVRQPFCLQRNPLQSAVLTAQLPILQQLQQLQQQNNFQLQQQRGFGRVLKKRGKKPRAKARTLHYRKRKEKNRERQLGAADAAAKDEASVAVQHREWVDFQKSIAVSGFETGQLTDVISGHTRGRQRRAQLKAQKRLEKRIQEQRAKDRQYKMGEVQAAYLPEEETKRLLAEADAHMPPREGPRGTRRQKRLKHKFWLIRREHKKKKKELIKAHFRLMEKRSRIRRELREVLLDAPERQLSDKEYQLESFRRWAIQTGQAAKLGIVDPDNDDTERDSQNA